MWKGFIKPIEGVNGIKRDRGGLSCLSLSPYLGHCPAPVLRLELKPSIILALGALKFGLQLYYQLS